MEQPPQAVRERRRYPRLPKAFAFWFRPEGASLPASAWMLNTSEGGAAFLTASDEAPPIGARLHFMEMPTQDQLVRDGAGPLPAVARVVRHDDVSGMTRRVAVRFEAVQRIPLAEPAPGQVSASELPQRALGPVPPPTAPGQPWALCVSTSTP